MADSIKTSSEVRQDVSIRGDNVQRIYSFFRNGVFIVNRKYQRKLVWNVEEKQKFIDSISKTYPVPLFLLATAQHHGTERFEIIDGMQRLNAICSFIEQEFGIISEDNNTEKYFDLETMAETKYLNDKGILTQKEPKLDRVTCLRIANYPLPLSIYTIDSSNQIDEIFRRINSGGRQLSHQEVRQSSSLGYFADAVRKIASKIRGDDSQFDVLTLGDMSKISVSNKQLGYGIKVDDIFWVKQSVLSREKLRQSSDEEIVADALGSMLLPDHFTSNKDLLDNLYGIYSLDSPTKDDRHKMLENNLSKDQEYWINVFIRIYDEIKQIIQHSNTNLNNLINVNSSTSRYSPKQFLTLFWSLYELIFKDKKVIADYVLLGKKLESAKRISRVTSGYYSGKNKRINVDALKGVISSAFREKASEDDDPAATTWFTKIENILVYNYTEQALCEFKQGFHQLNSGGTFDSNLVVKIVKTLTAMANYGKNAKGYLIVGIADDENASERIFQYYNNSESQSVKFNKFYINGVNAEVESYYEGNFEKYILNINNQVKSQPIDKGFLANNISTKLVNYYDKSLLVFEVKSAEKPVYFGDQYFVRNSNENIEVKPKDFGDLYNKFN